MPTKKRPEKGILIAMYTRGLSDGAVAKELCVDPSTVWRWRRHYGIQLTMQRRFFAQLHKGE